MALYGKDKNHVLNVRLSDVDFEFLLNLCSSRNRSVSDTVRNIISWYRLKSSVGGIDYVNVKTDFNDKL